MPQEDIHVKLARIEERLALMNVSLGEVRKVVSDIGNKVIGTCAAVDGHSKLLWIVGTAVVGAIVMGVFQLLRTPMR